MNYEVQGWRGLTSVENSSTVVGRTGQGLALSMVAVGRYGSREQSAARMHNRATAVGQVFHGGYRSPFASQPAAGCCFTNMLASRIDSRAARFSTTPEYLKL
jgi:hypothetical protein